MTSGVPTSAKKPAESGKQGTRTKSETAGIAAAPPVPAPARRRKVKSPPRHARSAAAAASSTTEQADLTPRWTIRRRILHHLQILVMMRKRFDEAEEQLLRMELLGLVTRRDVAHMLRLGELVVRAASGIEAMVVDSAQDPDTTAAVVADRVFEVERLLQLTLRDYLDGEGDEARGALAGVLGHKLAHTWLVETEIGLSDLDGELVPRGHRLLYRTGVVTKRIRGILLEEFPDAQALLHAPLERLMDVKGVGHKTATKLRHYFDRLLAAVHPIGQRVLTDRRKSYNRLP